MPCSTINRRAVSMRPRRSSSEIGNVPSVIGRRFLIDAGRSDDCAEATVSISDTPALAAETRRKLRLSNCIIPPPPGHTETRVRVAPDQMPRVSVWVPHAHRCPLNTARMTCRAIAGLLRSRRIEYGYQLGPKGTATRRRWPAPVMIRRSGCPTPSSIWNS